jgi:hypothetical protein
LGDRIAVVAAFLPIALSGLSRFANLPNDTPPPRVRRPQASPDLAAVGHREASSGREAADRNSLDEREHIPGKGGGVGPDRVLEIPGEFLRSPVSIGGADLLSRDRARRWILARARNSSRRA